MLEGLAEMWNRFSLTEEEQSDVVIEKEWVEDTIEKSKNCLLGKMVTRKPVNIEAIKNVFMKLWKINKGMIIWEVGDRLFIFQFNDELENDRVIQK
ncbi:hypothetical protein CRYUN_Cryun28dG0005100 [Craigia yunnanensis]